MTKQEAAQIPLLLHCTNDAERIGDHTAIIRNIINEMQENELRFSPDAEKEYDILHDKLTEIAELSAEMLTKCTTEHLQKSAVLHSDIDRLLNQFESEHVARINSGNCSPQVGILYLELLSEIRKIARHLLNIDERAKMFYADFTVEQKKV